MTGPRVVGVDLGGTNMQIGVVDAHGAIIASRRQKTRATEGRDAVIARMVKGITKACDEAKTTIEDIAAFGIAAPGAIDMPHGIVLEAPNLGWTDTPLRDILAEKLRRPVVVENDVNAAVWGEYVFGAGRGCTDLLGVWLGTGVGGGLILNGRVHHGPLFTAGEIGQNVALIDAPEFHRTVEDLCSRTGISRIIEARLSEHPDSILHEITGGTGRIAGSKKLARAIAADDPLAVAVVARAAVVLGTSIANWVTTLALDRVIIGGGLAEALGAPFIRDIRKRFEADVFPARNRVCELRLTELLDDSGLLGAALLAQDEIDDQR
jgi:glucokinase